MDFRRWTTGLALALAALTGPAAAAPDDFFGIWVNGPQDNSGIARAVVSPLPGGGMEMQLYGRCAPECDWGAQRARIYSDDPGSQDVRSIAADFDSPGGVKRHVTLRLAVGGSVRFDVQTDYAAGGGNSFATSGNLARAGDWRTQPRVADATPPAPGQPAAPPPPPSGGGWFSGLAGSGSSSGGSSLVGVGAALPPGYIPSKWEECTPFNRNQTRVANVDGRWQVGDFSHTLFKLGSSQETAKRALAMLNFYEFDEQCVVTRDAVQMVYWKRAGLVPKNDMPEQDCTAVDPANVKAVETDGAWKVLDGTRQLFDFDDDKASAERAVSVITTHKLNRQCFVARGNQKAQYWLSQ